MFVLFVVVRSTVVFLLAFCLTILQSRKERREFRREDSRDWRIKMYFGGCRAQGIVEQPRELDGGLTAKTTSASSSLRLQDK